MEQTPSKISLSSPGPSASRSETTLNRRDSSKKHPLSKAKIFTNLLQKMDHSKYISEHGFDLFYPKSENSTIDFLVALYAAACSTRFPAIEWNEHDKEWFIVDFRILRRCFPNFDDDECKINAFKWWMQALDFHRVEAEDFPGPYKFAFFHPDMKQHDISAFHRLVGKRNKNETRVDEAKNTFSPIFNEKKIPQKDHARNNCPVSFPNLPQNKEINENSALKMKKHSNAPSLFTNSQINTRLNN
ncbi:unnamed protein product [Oikopleura dioica]|uniref:Uncharacterized protein n=1 Tax=Oikopleura dioica TaxID=34765 RepID=E4XN04_OIKDI|nr:unnamed protein product [Oikopleura dioica]